MSLITISARRVGRATAICATVCVLALSSGAQAAPISSSIDLQPNADGTITTVLDSQGTTLNPLSGTVTSNGINGNSATSTASASWLSAGQGSVTLSNNWNTVGPGSFNFSPVVRQFTYRFIADASGLFQMNWTDTLTGISTFGSQFFILDLENFTTPGTQVQQAIGFNSSGSQSFSLLAGTEYEFGIRAGSNAGGAFSDADVTHTLQLDWTAPINEAVVVAVSAPGQIAVFGFGLIGLGLVRRRRRS